MFKLKKTNKRFMCMYIHAILEFFLYFSYKRVKENRNISSYGSKKIKCNFNISY